PGSHGTVRDVLRALRRPGDPRRPFRARPPHVGLDAGWHVAHALLALPALFDDRWARLGSSARRRRLLPWQQPASDRSSSSRDRHRRSRGDRDRDHHRRNGAAIRVQAIATATPPTIRSAPMPPITCAVPIVSESAAAARTGIAVAPLMT